MNSRKTIIRSLAAFTIAFLIGVLLVVQIEISRESKRLDQLEALAF